MTASHPAIVTHALTKTFRIARRREGGLGAIRSFLSPLREDRTVVSDLTITVARGELVALLGPNGAGKSTSIKMLTGILTPTSGDVLIDGRIPHRNRILNARSIGVVFGQKTQLWWDLPARQSLTLLGDIYEIPAADYKQRITEFDSILELSRFWDTPVRNLSLGQRVRCDLAAAMLHDPPIVFLDEPTIGMDIVVKEQAREFLRYQVRERGRTVLLTTHDMAEVDRLCERVMLINDGRLMFDGTIRQLKAEHGGPPQVRVTFSEPVADLRVAGARLVHSTGLLATLEPVGMTATEDIARALIMRYPVVNIGVAEKDIEELVRDIYLAATERSLAHGRSGPPG